MNENGFEAAYRAFICKIREKLVASFEEQKVKDLVATTVDVLLGGDNVKEVSMAAGGLESATIQALTLEMNWVATRDYGTDQARFFQDATTVKESLEKLLGGWIKKPVIKELWEILNELLKLAPIASL